LEPFARYVDVHYSKFDVSEIVKLDLKQTQNKH